MSTTSKGSGDGARMSHRLPSMSGRAKSCTSCRQVKLRCDFMHVFPESCTRCKKKNLDCKLDPSFKRTPVRGRLEEVTKKLNRLQQALVLDSSEASELGYSNGQQDIRAHSKQLTAASPSAECLEITEREHISGSISCFGLETLGGSFSSLESRQLGEVIVSGKVIGELFLHFCSFRDRHLPILNTAITVEDLYMSSPILFWTIVVVSSRQNLPYSDLHVSLADPYQALLSTVLIRPVTSLKTIQAILLLCLWPFSVKHPDEEISLNICGMAINAALQMGLHRPNNLNDYKAADRTSSKLDSMMTWMACFQISTILSSHLGLPPTLGSDLHLEFIRSMCRDPLIPRAFSAQVEIQRHVARYISALDMQSDPHSRCSVTHLFDRELEAIRSEFLDDWSGEIEFSLLGAKLYLYALCFAARTVSPYSYLEQDHQLVMEASSRAVLYQGLATVVRLVQVFSSFTDSCPAKNLASLGQADLDRRIFYPKLYYRILFFAVCFLLFFLSKDSRSTEEDKATVQKQVDAIHQIFSSASNSAEHTHAAKNIQALRNAITLGIRNSDDIVTTRLGASIFFNAIRATKKLKRRNTKPLQNQMALSGFEQLESDPPRNESGYLESSLQLDSEMSGWQFPWNLWDSPLQSGSGHFDEDLFSLPEASKPAP